MFNFIWDSPVDKTKRNVCKQSYHEGGLKFMDIKKHTTALKSTLMRRYLTDNGKWKIMFDVNFDTQILFSVGNMYI